jgi:hypothetical protein
MQSGEAAFLKPGVFERGFNRLFARLLSFGIGLSHNYLLEVRGRRSGQTLQTPVNLLEAGGRRYLVCPRGRSQWVRNAEASGRVVLCRGFRHCAYGVRPVPDSVKPALLKLYLDRFKPTVQRFFPVPGGAPAEAFAPYAGRYPVFELLPQRARPAAGEPSEG